MYLHLKYYPPNNVILGNRISIPNIFYKIIRKYILVENEMRFVQRCFTRFLLMHLLKLMVPFSLT